MSKRFETRRIHVAAAAIVDAGGRVLISRRAEHLHQGGLWEFPGGKLEPGESPRQALVRELKEELDILPKTMEPLIRIQHQYDERLVRLDFFRVEAYEGEARGMEGQPLQWLAPQSMRAEDFPAADRPVITALQLADRYLITGETAEDSSRFLHRLEASLRSGIVLLQLRAHGLDDRAYRELLSPSLQLCRDYGGRLIINRPRDVCRWAGQADGIHLPARQLMALQSRPQGAGLCGASCHNSRELARAAELQLDYALLSPVLPTASHPLASALGWEAFGRLVDRVNLPVYALGGMGRELLARAKEAGAQGVAGIRGFWAEI